MLNALILVILMVVSLPAFAKVNPDDPNTESMTAEELRAKALNDFDKVCVSARCYENNYAGSDIGECSTPQIVPKGVFDPCNPTQTADASSSENTIER